MEMKGRLTDAAFLQLVGGIVTHNRNPLYSAPSYAKSKMDFWDVAGTARAENAEFAYSTHDHAEMRIKPCAYCGAAFGGIPTRLEEGAYMMANMISLCVFCAVMKGKRSDKLVREKFAQIDARHRRCKCNAPRFMDTGMCARAYLTKMCEQDVPK